MKAWVLNKPGDVNNLELQEVAQPTIKDNEVLIKAIAISVNPIDVKVRQGYVLYDMIKNYRPLILGWDVAGRITAVGSNVSKFKVGDEVFGFINFPGMGSCYAEYVAAPEEQLAFKPDNISFAAAAAGSLAATTAWQVLVKEGHIKAGQKVLIQAAAGGVGHFAVQIAKLFGAYTIGTSSAANAGFLQKLGLDQHIDYHTTKVEDVLHDVDLVFNAAGPKAALPSLKTLKKGGKLISIGGGLDAAGQKEAARLGINAIDFITHSDGDDIRKLAELYKEESIKIHVSQTYFFDRIKEAQLQLETGKTRAKIAIEL